MLPSGLLGDFGDKPLGQALLHCRVDLLGIQVDIRVENRRPHLALRVADADFAVQVALDLASAVPHAEWRPPGLAGVADVGRDANPCFAVHQAAFLLSDLPEVAKGAERGFCVGVAAGELLPSAAILEPLGLELLAELFILVAAARTIDRIVLQLLFGRQRAREALKRVVPLVAPCVCHSPALSAPPPDTRRATNKAAGHI